MKRRITRQKKTRLENYFVLTGAGLKGLMKITRMKTADNEGDYQLRRVISVIYHQGSCPFVKIKFKDFQWPARALYDEELEPKTTKNNWELEQTITRQLCHRKETVRCQNNSHSHVTDRQTDVRRYQYNEVKSTDCCHILHCLEGTCQYCR